MCPLVADLFWVVWTLLNWSATVQYKDWLIDACFGSILSSLDIAAMLVAMPTAASTTLSSGTTSFTKPKVLAQPLYQPK